MANVNIKFNNKDYLLSCDDGEEESLKKLLEMISQESQYDKILQSNRKDLEEICVEIDSAIKRNVNYGQYNFKNTSKELKELLSSSVF